MKRKFFAAFLSLCMVMSLVPMTALAAEDTGTTWDPTASGNNFFANGTPITITETAPKGGTPVTFDAEFTATGESAYISWDDNATTKYVGVSEAVSVWGGADGSSSPVSVGNASITMTGGTVKNILGGNLGQKNATQDGCSSVTGNVDISITGGSVTELIYGGGENNTCVNGIVTITLEEVTLGAKCYVNGGVLGHGTEGDRNIEAGTMTTRAVVNEVIINATNSTAYVLGGGGSGSTKVKEAIVTLNGCTVANLYASGINGEMEKSSLKATDCKVTGELAATNRGFVGTGRVDLNACNVKKLNTGAAEGCFTSDSGTPDGSGVTGSVVWSLDDETIVAAAQLTPLVVRTGDTSNPTYATTYKNVTIQKEGTPLDLKVTSFVANAEDESATQKAFMVPEGSTLTLNNVKTTITDGNTLTNAGTINMDDASKLTVAPGATLEQAGTVNGDVVVDKGGMITEYVARVGNTGYKTLVDALAHAGENDTITLLADITDKNVGTPADDSIGEMTLLDVTKSVTIKGNGNIITLTVPDDDSNRNQVINVGEQGENGKVTLKLDDVNLTITGRESGDNYVGDAFNLWGGAELVIQNSTLDLDKLSSAFTVQVVGATITVDKSTITSETIGGNFSQGGYWTVENGSSITVTNCKNHGLSVSSLTLTGDSAVSVTNAGYRGISINDENGKLEIQDSSVVNVTNAGKADDATTPRDAVYLSDKATEGLIVQEGATLNVTAGENGNDRIELSEKAVSASKLNGTIIGTVKLPENSTSYVVTYVSNNQQITTTIADKDTPIRLLNALPNQGYNHFMGWRSSVNDEVYPGGKEVTISADTTFTAVWNYIPPANPNYRIDIPAVEGGTITADPAAAKAGAEVTLTATPDEGYAVGTITVTDRFGDAVKVTENADGTYTFTMPNGQVTVKATFVETEEPAPAEPFPDVDENDWFYDEVVYVYENGLMNGVENNRFAPNTATNRAMLATILYRLAGEPAVSGDLPFTDVESGTWYTDAVLWAAQNGIVNGLGENTFAPMNTLTREQLVTMLYRYAEAEGYDVSAAADLSGYPDADKVQTYAQEAMSWAVAEGIVAGMDGNLNPAGSATRAQIATILMRFCEDVAQ